MSLQHVVNSGREILSKGEYVGTGDFVLSQLSQGLSSSDFVARIMS